MKSNPILAIGLAFAISSSLANAKSKDVAAATPTPSASAATPQIPDVVATVDGKNITKADLDKALDDVLQAQGQTSSAIPEAMRLAAYNELLNDIVIDKLLTKAAANEKISGDELNAAITKFKTANGFATDADFDKALKEHGQTLAKFKEHLTAALKQKKWVDAQTAGKMTVSDKDVKDFYDQHPESFKQPAEVQASHILIQVPQDAKPEVVAAKKKEIETIAARIKKGEDFAKVAAEVSEDPGSKTKGGDLGFFPQEGAMVPEFSNAAFKLAKGEVSAPVRTQFGFHLIKVTDKKDARTIPFDEAKPKIAEFLKAQKQQQATRDVLEGLRKKADVKVFLPAPPQPQMPPQTPAANDETANPNSAASTDSGQK